jgi:hypothetical protein
MNLPEILQEFCKTSAAPYRQERAGPPLPQHVCPPECLNQEREKDNEEITDCFRGGRFGYPSLDAHATRHFPSGPGRPVLHW